MSNLLNIQGNFSAPVSIGDNLVNGYTCSVSANTYSHAEGGQTTANGFYSHAEGLSSIASGDQSHATGSHTEAFGENSTTFGLNTSACGAQSIAAGENVVVEGTDSIAIGIAVSSTKDNSFTWNGVSSATYRDLYDGSFNVNPVNGADGFYIGGVSLNKHINDKFDNKIKEYISYDRGSFQSSVAIVSSNNKITRSSIKESELNTLSGMTTNIKNKINNVENTLTSKIENVKNTLNNSAYASSTVNSIVHKNGLEYIDGIKKFLSGNISIFNPYITGKGSLNEHPAEEEYRSSIDFKGVRPNSTSDQLGLSSNIGGIQSSIKGNITRTDIYATKYNSTAILSSKISINYFSDGNKDNDVYFTYVDTPVGPDKISYALGDDKGSEYDHQITNVLWTRTELNALDNKINSNFVKLSDAQTITGKKTFSTSPIINNIDTANEKSVATIGYVSDSITDNNKSYYTKTEVDNKDNQLVTLSTNQTISGIKTFTKYIRLQDVNINTETETSKATNVKSVKDFVNKRLDDVAETFKLSDVVHKTNTESFSISAGNNELAGNKNNNNIITWNDNQLVDIKLLNSTVSTSVNALATKVDAISAAVDERIKYTWYRKPAIVDDLTNQVYNSSKNLDKWWNWNWRSNDDNIKEDLKLEEDVVFSHNFYAKGIDLTNTDMRITVGVTLNIGSLLKQGSKLYILKGQMLQFLPNSIAYNRNGEWVLNTNHLYYYNYEKPTNVQDSENIFYNSEYVEFDTDVKIVGYYNWNCTWGAYIKTGSTLFESTVLPAGTVIKKGTILHPGFIVPEYEIILSKSIRDYDEIMIVFCSDDADCYIQYKTYPVWLWDKFVNNKTSGFFSIGYYNNNCNINRSNIGYQNFTVRNENNLLGCVFGIKYDPTSH